MVNDILLLAIVAILAGAAVELHHGTSDRVAFIPLVQAGALIGPSIVPVSCEPDEKIEAHPGYRTD